MLLTEESMSADNGIYVLIYPVEITDQHGTRIVQKARVSYAMAIDNIYYDNGVEQMDADGHNVHELVEYFGRSPEMTVEEAQKRAFELEAHHSGYLEYGISTIRKTVPFPDKRKEV